MHRSRISTSSVDVPAAEAARSAAFWSMALGVPAEPAPGEEQFIDLPDGIRGLLTAVQPIDGAPRYHLDMETDDVDAETDRLVGLDAVEITRWEGCRTLQVPGGQLVCVIPARSDPAEFAAGARVHP